MDSSRDLLAERIGRNLRAAREAKGLSQMDVYDIAGIAQAQLSKWELGKRLPELPALIKLAKLFDVTVPDLIAPDEQPNGDEHEPAVA